MRFMAKNISKSNFLVGDLVLVTLESRKRNQNPYKGPHKIVKRLGVNSLIYKNSVQKLFHNNIIKFYKKKHV